MGLKDNLENTFVKTVLRHVLDGNAGSNWMTLIVAPLLAADINWVAAMRGFTFSKTEDTQESAKFAGLLVLALWGVCIGNKRVAVQTGVADVGAAKAAEAGK